MQERVHLERIVGQSVQYVGRWHAVVEFAANSMASGNHRRYVLDSGNLVVLEDGQKLIVLTRIC
ncbi:hypothetical protein ABW16_05105 [Mycolicibacter heraklionensis]|uniref:Uncharacterized protein n=1 Tax=Mycolicibacter heraklionensis TaxID=512402 RepID=A0ABR5FJG6_9MYCO|nr:hypothetical protein ABW16_05105 [Mycolicibacter heraklionensis]